MTQPNDSILVTPGTGATVATHLVDGKEYQVVLIAHPDSGHLRGTIPTYTYWRPFAAGAQNQRTLDIFNAAGSGVVVKLRKLFVHHNGAAVTGVAHLFDFIRTSAVGTGGTVITGREQGNTGIAIPAGVTCRLSATGGATETFVRFGISLDTEETRPGTQMAALFNLLAEGDDIADIVLAEGEGFLVKQITSSTVGVWGTLLVVTIE